MAPEAVQPLRINKTSPSKMTSPPASRPLTEIGPTERRRNSPSFDQTTKKPYLTETSSPFDATPSLSPKRFWGGRDLASPTHFDSENAPICGSSPSSTRRSSLEKLQKASRVKNSNMFVRENNQVYDPASSPNVERPLAGRRPLASQYQDVVQRSSVFESPSKILSHAKGHRRTESSTKIPLFDATNQEMGLVKHPSPPKAQTSPHKSSMSCNTRSSQGNVFDPEEGTWSDSDEHQKMTPRAALRQRKSVTFDAAPPQVNEYEMATPDLSSLASGSREGSCDSDVYESSDCESSVEREDSFDASLEDTDKTPVVLPEDWRFMSPMAARTDLANAFDDPFDKPDTNSSSDKRDGDEAARVTSFDSNGDPRPLPPLPGARDSARNERSDSISQTISAELMIKAQRSLPSPPRPALISKAEILKMRESPMPLDERLRLLSLQKQAQAAKQLESSQKKEEEAIENADETQIGEVDARDVANAEGYLAPPRISRESILRKVQSERLHGGCDVDHLSPRNEQDEIDYASLDPDVPIPSLEIATMYGENDNVMIKQEDDEEEPDSHHRSPSWLEELNRESSVIHYQPHAVDENEADDEEPLTPRAVLIDTTPSKPLSSASESRMGLPEFTSLMNEDFGLGLRSYMSPSPPPIADAVLSEKEAKPETREISEPCPKTPEAQILSKDEAEGETEEFGTSGSVIRHSISAEPLQRDSPIVPEPEATVKAPGTRLKTRPSATPTDLQAMASVRQHISVEQPAPGAPQNGNVASGDEISEVFVDRSEDHKVKLDMQLEEPEKELGISLDTEFDRLLEAKKKGYLMRQNTKVIVASNRQFSDERLPENLTADEAATAKQQRTRETRSAGNSPRKPSAQTWTTEPWNGKMRRRSIRQSIVSPEKRGPMGGVPPLPGAESNVTGHDSTADSLDEGPLDDGSGERGRLFVKVVGAKELDLTLPRNEQTWFQLTLDNGLHCVTTAPIELGKTAPIGQEFELVVFDELEFQLTLQTKLERPKSQASSFESITKTAASPKKAAGFSRLFTSPKKRKEQEKKQLEEEAYLEQIRQQELEAKRQSLQPTVWDLLHDFVAPDGSFARAYICLQNHERDAFGRPLTFDVPLWNEWAVEDSSAINSTRSKLGGIQRKPPYKIGKLEIQLLYIPKPKGVKEEDMPKSMSACVRDLKEAEAAARRQFEGHLSQQGGDCPYWRRRFFKLNGSKLTAYHEATRQPRATINLAKATKLIDDRSSLTQSGDPKSPTKVGRGRRKSAFAEDEEGYMFVEEGFRIRFANGEVIDFYAENTPQKEQWMKVLSEVVGKDVSADKPTWTAAVLAKERIELARKTSKVAAAPKHIAPRRGTKSVPTSPAKKSALAPPAISAHVQSSDRLVAARPPPPVEKSPRHVALTPATSPTKASAAKATEAKAKATTAISPKKSPGKTNLPAPTPRARMPNARRGLVRSMIF